jgi:hypothetical protein
MNKKYKYIKKLEKMFTREELIKNSYLINRMNMDLEIPLEVVFNERKIKSISQDNNLILKVNKII